jgi:pimeloyl-ACP methyl ester carboxylesterase
MSAAPTQKSEKDGQGGCLVFGLGLVVGVPLLALCGLTLAGPPSIETCIFTFAVLLGVIAALASPWRRTRPLVVGALALALAVVGYRHFSAASGKSVHESLGPAGGAPRWIDRLVPERDVALGGSGLLIATNRMPQDAPGLLDALRDGYSRMRLAEGPVPSAVLGTFLFGQSPDEHSVLRIAPPRFEPPEAVVLFLHGYIGNVTLLCWQVAQAANPVGIDVVCPSTGWEARWAEPDGRLTVERTIGRLRAEGVRRIYLAGLSAGAIGASSLAPTLDVDGLILISGASPEARAAGKPTIVLQGRIDAMTPAHLAREYAERTQATYLEQPEAGHWLLLSHHEWVMEHLRRWLAEQEGLGRVHDAAQ